MSDPEPLQLGVRVVCLVVELAAQPDGLVEVVADVEGGVVGGTVLVVDEPRDLGRQTYAVVEITKNVISDQDQVQASYFCDLFT